MSTHDWNQSCSKSDASFCQDEDEDDDDKPIVLEPETDPMVIFCVRGILCVIMHTTHMKHTIQNYTCRC